MEINGLWNESIKPPATSDNSLNPRLDHYNNPKFLVEFNGSCLKTDSACFNYETISLYATHKITL